MPGRNRNNPQYNDEQLDPSELRFVENIMAGMSPERAYRAAGYTGRLNHSTGPLTRPLVQDAIARRQKEEQKRLKITRQDVIDGFKDAIRDAKLASDPMSQIAGWREIARVLGLYEPERKVVEFSDKREVALRQLQELDMEDLMELAGSNVIDAEFELIVEAPRALEDRH